MKKIKLLFLGILFFNLNFAQVSFEKNKIVTGMNYDLNVYSTEVWDNSPNSVHKTDHAASKILSLWSEYAVTNWLGVGFKLGYGSFIADKDSASGIIPTASAADYGVQISAHVLRKKHFNLPFTFAFGGSAFRYYNNCPAPNDGSLKGGGLSYSFCVNPSFFFGKSSRIGLNIKLGYAAYSYSSLVEINNNITSPYLLTFKGGGGSFGMGIQYNIR